MTASGSALTYLRVHADQDRAVVIIDGELDAASADCLAEAMAAVLAWQPARLVIDLRRVGFVDCAALRVIVSAAAVLPAGALTLRRPSPAVRRIINLTGLGADMVAGRMPRSAPH
mgnify:CR=1 FL=1